MVRPNARRNKQSSTAPAWAWFVLGTFVGGFAVFILLLNNLKAGQPQTAKAERKLHHSTAAQDESKHSKPRFDFYTLLEENEAKVPQPSARKTRNDDTLGAAVNSGSRQPAASELYILQAASFRDAREADKLRAQLTLLNLNVQVEISTDMRGTWHRVLVGPYQNRSKVAKARQLLAEHRLMPLVLKRPGKI